jgi:hypothetical protein
MNRISQIFIVTGSDSVAEETQLFPALPGKTGVNVSAPK